MKQSYWKEWQQTRSQQKLHASLALCGHEIVTIVSKRVDRKVVIPLLPSGVQLGPPGPDGRYTMLYTFAYQQFVRPAWAPPIFSDSYLECIVAVQSVELPQPGTRLGPFAAFGKLYSESFVAWILGRLIGYPKVLGKIETGESSYRIRTLSGRLILSATFEPNGTVENPFYGAAYGAFRDFSTTPGLTKAPFGAYLSSVLDFDREIAQAQPVFARLEIEALDLPGLPQGVHCFCGTDADPLAAMRVHIPWTLSLERAASRDIRSAKSAKTSG